MFIRHRADFPSNTEFICWLADRVVAPAASGSAKWPPPD